MLTTSMAPVSQVPDPFYVDRAAFATIPRDWLSEFLVRCSRHGIRVLFDLHAFPGGSSQGTYNGVSRWCVWFSCKTPCDAMFFLVHTFFERGHWLSFTTKIKLDRFGRTSRHSGRTRASWATLIFHKRVYGLSVQPWSGLNLWVMKPKQVGCLDLGRLRGVKVVKVVVVHVNIPDG